MTTNVNGPHILIFERDQQLATLLTSELQLAGYECHAARTAVEVFDAIARHPVRLVLVNLAQAAAGRREFWVALDAQRRGRGVQVLTFRCSNIAGYGPLEPEEGNVTSADMEVDGMQGINELVEAVRGRIPSPVSTKFPQASAPIPAIQQPPQHAPFNPTPPAMPVVPPPSPIAPPPPATQSPSAFTEKIRAVIYPNSNRAISPGPDSGPGWTYNGPEGGAQAVPLRQQQPTPPQRTQQSSPPDNGRTSTTPTLSALANSGSNNHSEESGLARLSRLVLGNRGGQHSARPKEERARDYDDPMTITASHMRPSPIQDAPLERGAELHHDRPDVALRSNVANQQAQMPRPPQGQTQQYQQAPQTQQAQIQAQQAQQTQQAQQAQLQAQQTQFQAHQTQQYQQPPVQFSPVIPAEYIPAQQPIHYTIIPQSPQSPQSPQPINYATIPATPLSAQPAQNQMPPYMAQLMQQASPPEQFSPTQETPAYAPQTGQPNAKNNGAQTVNRPFQNPGYRDNSNPAIPVVEAGQPFRRSSSPTGSLEYNPATANRQKQVEENQHPLADEKAQDSGESSLSDRHRDLIEQIQSIVQGKMPQMLDEAQTQVATDDTLLDIVQSLPAMPAVPPPQTPQAQVLNGRATRSLGSVLLEGHLVPQDRLEVAQGIQRMLRGVDLNYQLGEILLMFKLLTPDQLLAASLVSYGMINTQQISALGRVRQELHAIGLEYDLENLLIVFRILSADQLREVRTGF
ncbi:MAG TPA: hypothetical protein VFN23_06810 [Ktedonobacteraceae bacterium]|nr:hypothetical protein [Ktedonobacteraceae bacterium]